ncbi:MAG: Gfo/Idh/MocA family oxidoreductase [Candidatus Niyogibacteria bacterium]|nr:Gfo/Idh/MocA family oxidoreductase [Candidatus Niyogibacteria bacterium]
MVERKNQKGGVIVLEKAIIEEVSPVLLVGYGYMGKDYFSVLKEEGFADEDILVVDIDKEKLSLCKGTYPGARVFSVLGEALLKNPKTVFNLVNTPSHFKIFREIYGNGVKNHFIEKPLTFTIDELFQLEEMVAGDGELRVHVGYIINFSPAVTALMKIMDDNGLVVREARGFWGKDRTNNARPTPGDLEDEMTHPLNTMLNLVLCNQKITDMRVQGTVSYVPFANDKAQKDACLRDPSFPNKPTSTSHVALRLVTNCLRDILITVHSSFISFSQKRSVEVNLSSRNDPERPTHIAEIIFDAKGKDFLRFKEAGAKEHIEEEFAGTRKLQDQVRAFLRYAAGEEKDERLTFFDQAAFMVRLTGAILKSEHMLKI